MKRLLKYEMNANFKSANVLCLFTIFLSLYREPLLFVHHRVWPHSYWDKQDTAPALKHLKVQEGRLTGRQMVLEKGTKSWMEQGTDFYGSTEWRYLTQSHRAEPEAERKGIPSTSTLDRILVYIMAPILLKLPYLNWHLLLGSLTLFSLVLAGSQPSGAP